MTNTREKQDRPFNRREFIVTTVLNYLHSGIINDSQVDSTIQSLFMRNDIELAIALLESAQLKEKSSYKNNIPPSKIDNFFVFQNYPSINESPDN